MLISEKILEVFHPLIGLPLWSIGRAANLEWFQFGAERMIIDKKKGQKIVGQYALHVQCTWRITDSASIVVASRDRYYPSGDDPYKDLESFKWDTVGGNRCDERTAMLINSRKKSPLIVVDIQADEVGGVNIQFVESFSLNLFPDESVGGEYWRLFQPYTEKPHYVMLGKELHTE